MTVGTFACTFLFINAYYVHKEIARILIYCRLITDILIFGYLHHRLSRPGSTV